MRNECSEYVYPSEGVPSSHNSSTRSHPSEEDRSRNCKCTRVFRGMFMKVRNTEYSEVRRFIRIKTYASLNLRCKCMLMKREIVPMHGQ